MTEKITEVWIVQGSTGEDSDHCEWIVCGFSNERKAQKLVEELSKLGNSAFIKIEKTCFWQKTVEGKALLALDPSAHIDYTGINYAAFKVEIRE